jgi:hypothetical protein
MTEEKDWQELGEEWRQSVPVFQIAHKEILSEAQRSSRKALWLGVFSFGSATIIMALLIILALSHRSVLTYSFAIIGLSAFLPIGSYLAVHRRNIVPDALDSASMLDTLLKQQLAKRDLLEFLRILLGVETIIATAFWLAATGLAAWHDGLVLFGFGVLLAGLAWWQRKRAEGSIQSLQGLRATLTEQGNQGPQ